jgi:hypothetical protein
LNAEHFSLCHFAEEVYADSLAARGGAQGAMIDPMGDHVRKEGGR